MHGNGESRVSPARNNAKDVTILKVDPGAACPVVASGSPLVAGEFAAATISPVDGRIATRLAEPASPASVASAASCACRSSVVVRLTPAPVGG